MFCGFGMAMHEVKFIVVASHTPAATRRHPTARQQPPPGGPLAGARRLPTAQSA